MIMPEVGIKKNLRGPTLKQADELINLDIKIFRLEQNNYFFSYFFLA